MELKHFTFNSKNILEAQEDFEKWCGTTVFCKILTVMHSFDDKQEVITTIHYI